MMGDRRGLQRRLDAVGEAGADRLGHRHMGHAARPEERLRAGEGAVDELVDDAEGAGRQMLAERAAGRQRHQIGDACPLQTIDVGAVVDVGGRQAMAAAVAGQEHHIEPGDAAETQVIGGLAPRAFDALPAGIVHVDVIKAGAADDAENGFAHGVTPTEKMPRPGHDMSGP